MIHATTFRNPKNWWEVIKKLLRGRITSARWNIIRFHKRGNEASFALDLPDYVHREIEVAEAHGQRIRIVIPKEIPITVSQDMLDHLQSRKKKWLKGFRRKT